MGVFGLLTLALVGLIVIGFPVGFAAGVISAFGLAEVHGSLADPRVASALARTMLDRIDGFLLLSVPFFLLAGRLMNGAGITVRLFEFVSAVTRPLRGGLAHANVLASVLFAGMSGSATADAMGLGTIELKAMAHAGYRREFAVGITGASSLLSPIIPPSIALVAYAVVAEQSVGAMFLSAIVPGILLALSYMLYVAWRLRFETDVPPAGRFDLCEVWRSFRGAVLPILMPAIIVGGINLGIFTPTEAAAVAVFYAGAIGMIVFRELSLSQLVADLRGAMIDSAAIMLIIAFTSAFGQVLIRAQLPDQLAALATTLTADATVFLLLMILLWLVVGCFMAQTPAILILTPILLPVAEQYAIDPIHFGMVMALTLTLGLLTPPVGMVLYALVKVSGVPFERLVIVSFPYVVITALVCVVLVLVPDLVLALPRLAR